MLDLVLSALHEFIIPKITLKGTHCNNGKQTSYV